MRAAMIRIDFERGMVVLHRFIEDTDLTVAVAKHAVRVSILWLFLNRLRQMTDGRFEILRLNRLTSRDDIRILGFRFGLRHIGKGKRLPN